MNFHTRYIDYFLAVAEMRSFSRAAESLGVSQPALSLRIRQEENQFGLQVFDRSTRMVRVTEQGEIVLEALRDLKGAAARAARSIAEARNMEVEPLRLGISVNSDFPERTTLLTRFREENPGVIVEQVSANTFPLLVDLKAGSLDIVIAAMPADPSLEAMVLRRFDAEAIVPRESPLAIHQALTPTMLKDVSIVTFRRGRQPLLYTAIMEPLVEAGARPFLPPDESATGSLAFAAAQRMILICSYPRYEDQEIAAAGMTRIALLEMRSSSLMALRVRGSHSASCKRFWASALAMQAEQTA